MKGRPQRWRPAGNGKSAGSFRSRPVNHHDRGGRDRKTFATAQRSYEQYLTLAREASSSGDIVEMENCYQHAERYFRVMRETRVAGD